MLTVQTDSKFVTLELFFHQKVTGCFCTQEYARCHF